MPNVNLTNVTESTGTFATLTPGGYVCRITSVEMAPDKQLWWVCWDVAEGADKDTFAGSNFPPRDCWSYKESALGMIKHKLHVLTDSNPGFDADAAYKPDESGLDHPERFVGKLFGAVVRERLYTRRDGTDGTGIEVGAWVSVDDIRSGSFQPLKARDCRTHSAPAPAAPVAEDDIPF